MKQLTVVFLVLLAACDNCTHQPDLTTLAGAYVRKIQHEHAVGTDSLFIRSLDEEAKTFSIVSHATYRRILDGKKQSFASEIQKYVCVFEDVHKQLKDPQKDEVFTWVPEKKVLLKGSVEFRRIE